MKKIFKEFKEFAVKGNMVDMAVGIVIGAAFSTIVKSLVDDIIMPIVSGVLRAPDFSYLFFIIRMPDTASLVDMSSIEAVRAAGGVAIGYGLFINAMIAFLIVSFSLFLVVKGINRIKKEEKEEAETSKEPTPSAEEVLLSEIRDILKK